MNTELMDKLLFNGDDVEYVHFGSTQILLDEAYNLYIEKQYAGIYNICCNGTGIGFTKKHVKDVHIHSPIPHNLITELFKQFGYTPLNNCCNSTGIRFIKL